MFYILIVLAIALSIILVTYFSNEKEKFRKENTIIATIFCIIIGGLFIIIPLAKSYTNYLGIKADYYGVIAQYEAAVDIYADKAIINVDKISFTDFKYEGYQKQMAQMIEALRYKVARYNSMYIKKKTIKKNLIFSWIIISPDSGMKLLQMMKDKKE